MKTNKNESPKYRTIKAIEDKYGLVVFRCALSHFISCGSQLLSNSEEVENTKTNIRKNAPNNSIMTADFQCAIIDCAVELSKVEVWDLFRYIQTDVNIVGCWN